MNAGYGVEWGGFGSVGLGLWFCESRYVVVAEEVCGGGGESEVQESEAGAWQMP